MHRGGGSPAEPASIHCAPSEWTKSRAFTMAEILLSLTIIGVVAAITLPSLTGNINERTWNTQRKALYARFSQAIPLMDAINGFGTLTEETSSGAGDAVDTAAETFITAGLAKVLKVNNICDSEHLSDCGITSKITTLGGSQITTPTTMEELNSKLVGSYSTAVDRMSVINTKAAAFETQNGESIIAFYNQSCRTEYLNNETQTQFGNTFGFPESTMCVNFIYDLNGNKGPNTVGKDIGFMTVFNATDSSVVAPVPANKDIGNSMVSHSIAISSCKNSDLENRLPNIDELSSMLINNLLLGPMQQENYWSSSSLNSEYGWGVSFKYGERATGHKKNHVRYVRCVKR